MGIEEATIGLRKPRELDTPAYASRGKVLSKVRCTAE
jgi:hypothetical protein